MCAALLSLPVLPQLSPAHAWGGQGETTCVWHPQELAELSQAPGAMQIPCTSIRAAAVLLHPYPSCAVSLYPSVLCFWVPGGCVGPWGPWGAHMVVKKTHFTSAEAAVLAEMSNGSSSALSDHPLAPLPPR